MQKTLYVKADKQKVLDKLDVSYNDIYLFISVTFLHIRYGACIYPFYWTRRRLEI